MNLLVSLVIPLYSVAGSIAPAAASPAAEPGKLIAQLRPAYARPGTFLPASLRFPLRLDVAADLKAKRAEAETRAMDRELRRELALLAEQAEDPAAESLWRELLDEVEPLLKKKPSDPLLLERQVEALVGSNQGLRVVPAAEKLRAGAPQNWRIQLLYGDARLRRADFNWRVCVRLGDRAKNAPQFAELLGDLAAAETAYGKAIELAPAEAAPRGARISLAMARMVMGSFLPRDTLPGAAGLEVKALRAELFDLCRRNPGKPEPLWHAAHLLATFGAQDPPLEPQERTFLIKALAEAQATSPTDRLFLEEARGMRAAADQDWSGARKAFEAAQANHPSRRFSAAWLAFSEARSGEPSAVVIERARTRLKVRESAEDYALLGLLLGSEERASAIEALRKSLQLDVENANARYNLALLLLRQRAASSEARHHLRQAIELEPENLEAQFTQAVTLALAGEEARARRALMQLKENPQLDKSLQDRIAAVLNELPSAANK